MVLYTVDYYTVKSVLYSSEKSIVHIIMTKKIEKLFYIGIALLPIR